MCSWGTIEQRFFSPAQEGHVWYTDDNREAFSLCLSDSE